MPSASWPMMLGGPEWICSNHIIPKFRHNQEYTDKTCEYKMFFLISIQEPSKTMEHPSLWAFDRILVQDSSHFQAAQHQGVQTTWILRYLISSYFPKNLWFQPIPKRSSPDTSVELWDCQVGKTYKFSPHPSVLGGLQVQDPGGSPGHCTQDHEDPNLEADAEEGVGLPDGCKKAKEVHGASLGQPGRRKKIRMHIYIY